MRRPAMRRPCLLLRWGRERAPGPANVCVCEHMWMCRSAVACTICRKAEDFFFFFEPRYSGALILEIEF